MIHKHIFTMNTNQRKVMAYEYHESENEWKKINKKAQILILIYKYHRLLQRIA